MIDGVGWEPAARVVKYSADQTRWAVRWLRERQESGFLPVHARLHGSWLQTLFPSGPEDGYAWAEGNSLTEAGAQNIARLIIGHPGALPLVPTDHASSHALIGVGSDSAANQTAPLPIGTLAPEAGEAPHVTWYQEMDPGFPQVSTPGTVDGQLTVSGDDANFPGGWQEWCWAAVSQQAATVRGPYLRQAAEGAVMLNRKACNFGTKQAGRSWVLQVRIRIAV